MTKHTHTSINETIEPYNGPVEGAPFDEVSHGNITTVQHCVCGATQRATVNGNHVAAGPWRNPIRWITWGSVRGFGPVRATQDEAHTDAERDAADCRSSGGGSYSDRGVYQIDRDGWVVDARGCNVYPHGKGVGALRALEIAA